jgi:sodium transport system permease protein
MVRDRRTLISTIVMPTLIMPAIILMVGKVASGVVAQAKAEVARVMVIGGADSPGMVAQLRDTGKFKVEPASPDWKALIAEKRVRAAVELPPGFERNLAAGSAGAVTLYDYRGELKSGLAEAQLSDFFSRLRTRAATSLLAARGLPSTIARPFEVKQQNVAPPEKVGGNLLGGLVPYFIILVCLVGAMHPAIDLTAGEKERGTLEMLLCSPATRGEIVLGKFLMVLTASLTSVFLSMLSMMGTLAAAGTAMASPDRGPQLAAMVDPLGILGVVAMIIPVSVLFSAGVFAIAIFAKSVKEAQSYLTPLILVVILPCGVGLVPGIELNFGLSLVPIVNLSLVCKEMLSGVWHWGYIAAIFGSTAAFAALALGAAVAMFRREGVVFRT